MIFHDKPTISTQQKLFSWPASLRSNDHGVKTLIVSVWSTNIGTPTHRWILAGSRKDELLGQFWLLFSILIIHPIISNNIQYTHCSIYKHTIWKFPKVGVYCIPKIMPCSDFPSSYLVSVDGNHSSATPPRQRRLLGPWCSWTLGLWLFHNYVSYGRTYENIIDYIYMPLYPNTVPYCG